MDDSPRSSKRRKLDPKGSVPNARANNPGTRTSGRLANRPTSMLDAGIDGEAEKPGLRGKTRASKRTTSDTTRKQALANEKDVYDDIDGALGLPSEPPPKPPPRVPPRRKYISKLDPHKPHPFKTASQEDTANSEDALDEIQVATLTPGRNRGKTMRNGNTANRGASRSVVNKHKLTPGDGDDTHDELAAKASVPPKRLRSNGRATGSAQRTATLRRSNVPRSSATPSKLRSVRNVRDNELGEEAPETEDEVPTIATPSRTSKRRSPTQKQSTIGDSIQEREDDASVDDDAISVVGSVLDPTEPSPFNKPSSAQKETLARQLLCGNISTGRELDLLKTIVMERIVAKRPVPLVGLDEEYKSVYQLVEHTITAGEGNSMLLIGARGSGKTALVNKVFSDVSKDNSEDYHVVRLNGFIHTDDKIALREIWRQLGKEMDIEDDSGLGKNYADTLTTLLALLSHPSEQTGELTDQVAKAVIFIMDEFDLFAHHPRQTLLYNLFDIAQSRKAPIAVLGLTTRIDVVNSLEKRVKSRFSHRYVHLSLAKSFTAFQEICKAILTLAPDQLSVEERAILESAPKNTPNKKPKQEAHADIVTVWNSNINSLFASKTFLTEHLAPLFYRTKSVPAVLNTFLLPTAMLSPATPLYPTMQLSASDSKLSLLPQLSTLSLSLLVAAARLDIIHDSDTCNFNMAYDEYVTLASKARIQSAAGGASSSGSVTKVWGKDIARREWEGLVELGLVMPVAGGLAGGFAMVRVDVALEEIGEVIRREKGIEKTLERWCRQI